MAYLYETFKTQALHFAVKTALISQGVSYSYAHILEQADLWAGFISSRYSERPRIALLFDDPFFNITLSLAIAKLDGACIPTNKQMLPAQMENGWQSCDVNIVIYEPIFSSKISACAPNKYIYISTEELNSKHTPLPQSTSSWSHETDYLITLSSGSTGTPKPIVVSQEVKVKRAQQTWDLYNLSDNDVVLCASPYFHSMGQRLIFVPLLLGATVVYLSEFTPNEWINLVEKHKVSFIICVSSHLYALKDALFRNTHKLSSLKTIVTSSAPIDAEFKKHLFEKAGCNFHEIYGATEVAVASNLAPEHATAKFSTVGLPCKDVSIKILNDDLNEIPIGEIGEIAVKSPLAFEGYYKQDALTQSSHASQYFLTGDLGSIDQEGFLSYVSRKKDVIISGGINIYPLDIEKILLSHPAIKEVAVIGVEDTLLGEVVIAICIPQDNNNVEPELRKLANANLATFQQPLKYFFTDRLPLTPSGKISKIELRKIYNPLNKDWTLPLRILKYGE